MKLEEKTKMSIDFNTNTKKKEDVSNRLKAHNIRRAKDETKKLEHESKKMEERLKELRMAMNKEKEEREQQGGGGYWSRGQTGNLNSYATDVLSKQQRSASKDGKKKVKVLKDTPLNLPERPSQPGTMAFIAKQDPGTSNHIPVKPKVKGPKCGQCEEKKANVSCVQCSEYYCAGCFAAFHLKGALKKHRSMPISAVGPRVCMSPRPMTPQYNSNSIDFHSSPTSGAENVNVMKIQHSHRDRNSPDGASGSFDGPSLMTGDYSEAESAASFQEALKAWRTGGAEESPRVKNNNQKKVSFTPRKASPVKSPVVQVDSGTGTVEEKTPIEINFHSNLSYAERLLLKKHRRTELQHMETPRLGDMPPLSFSDIDQEEPRSISATPRHYPDYHQNEPWIQNATTPRVQPFPVWGEEVNQEDMEVERVTFHALYEAVKSSQGPSNKVQNDDMNIVELDVSNTEQMENNSFVKRPNNRKSSRIEETSACLVQEVDDMEAWATNANINQQSNQDVFTESREIQSKPSSSRRGRRQAKAPPTPGGIAPEQSYPSVMPEERNLPSRYSSNKENSFQNYAKELSFSSEVQSRKSQKASKSRPPSSKSRPASAAKSRPQSSVRPKSRQTQQSRPGSRARSRAASRIEGEGILTKGPSQGLTQVAMMAHEDKQQSYSSAFNEFFMLGVKPEQTERTMTPSKHKGSQVEKLKVSNKLYHMSPSSWRPDSSLAENVPEDNVQADESVPELEISEEDQQLAEIGAAEMALAAGDGLLSARQQQSRAELLSSLTGSLHFEQDANDRLIPQDTGYFEDQEDTFPELPPTPSLRMTTPRSGSVRSRPDSGTPRPSNSSSRPHSRNLPKPPSHRPSSQMSQDDEDEITPRPSSRITPRPSSRITPRPSSRTTPRPNSRMTPRGGSFYRSDTIPIVVDGEDLTSYDTVGETQNRDLDDEETLDNLEWELASETGRITADGNISRMSVALDDDGDSTGSAESARSFSRMSQQEQGYDINTRLREDELADDSEEDSDEEEVRALH